jgi:hypothetical protein
MALSRRSFFAKLAGVAVGHFWLVYWCVSGVAVVAATILDQPSARLSAKDAIIACLQKDGVLVYAVTDKGPPKVGQPVTAEMFTVICVEEK